MTSEYKEDAFAHFHIQDELYQGAVALKSAFDSLFSDPYVVRQDRFIWDYWHVSGQYRYLRTFAHIALPELAFAPFMTCLNEWGMKNLGCGDAGEPWLSYYVDGCVQELHADGPNGAWAYVYSLTDWANRAFAGGETLMLTEHALDYWRTRETGTNKPLFQLIAPSFNRLTVFDPLWPHGVRRVEGAREPRCSRIAIHGWFAEPRLAADAISLGDVETFNHQLLGEQASITKLGVSGLLTSRVEFKESTEPVSVTILASTLRSNDMDIAPRDAAVKRWLSALMALRLKKRSSGFATIPLRI